MTTNLAYNLAGQWLTCKYREQAQASGVRTAAANMRKQGYPLWLARFDLAGSLTMKHTPGPWETSTLDGGEWQVCGPGGGDTIAALYNGNEEANANLIAAAPDLLAERDRLKAINAELLEALQTIENYIDAPHFSTERKYRIRDLAHAAIAKAEGPQ
jgi:hypothetical protein